MIVHCNSVAAATMITLAKTVLLCIIFTLFFIRESLELDMIRCIGIEKIVLCDGLNFLKIPSATPFPSAVQLSLKRNLLQKIERNDFLGWSSVQVLILKKNNISIIESGAFLSTLPELRRLDLSHNRITFPTSLGSDELPATLEDLDLSNNPLYVIPDNQFFSLRKLKVLNLASAQLHTVEPRALTGLVSLQRLYLFHNRFETLPRLYLLQSLNRMQALKSLLLGGRNPWRCDCRIRWLREWHLIRQDVNVTIVRYIGQNKREYGPTCASPPDMKSKGLFDPQVLPQEFQCPKVQTVSQSKKALQVTPTVTLLAADMFDATPSSSPPNEEPPSSAEDVIDDIVLYGSITAAWVLALCFAVGVCCCCIGISIGRRQRRVNFAPPEDLPPPFTPGDNLPELQACVQAIEVDQGGKGTEEDTLLKEQKLSKKLEDEVQDISYVSSV